MAEEVARKIQHVPGDEDAAQRVKMKMWNYCVFADQGLKPFN